ncbi:transposable element Tcb2 transposase [Trichonephila clavipes]|nr:transposable element Tcb2 transposase [Trichonephila clavipes]
MARIVHHNDESVREEYISIGGKEVKSFISALKAFQCDNRIIMVQRKPLKDFLRGRNYWTTGMWTYPAGNILESPRVSSPGFVNDFKMMVIRLDVTASVASELHRRMRTGIWQLLPKETDRAQHQTCLSDSRRTLIWRAPGTRYHQENTIERYRYGGAGWLVWGGVILGSRIDLHVQSVTMTVHIYWDVILEQQAQLFRGAMGAEFLFMDDNARPNRANIVDECL